MVVTFLCTFFKKSLDNEILVRSYNGGYFLCTFF
jgi:hypothetical protein